MGIEFAEFSLGPPQRSLLLGDCPQAVLSQGACSPGARWLRLLAALQWGHLCLISPAEGRGRGPRRPEGLKAFQRSERDPEVQKGRPAPPRLPGSPAGSRAETRARLPVLCCPGPSPLLWDPALPSSSCSSCGGRGPWEDSSSTWWSTWNAGWSPSR